MTRWWACLEAIGMGQDLPVRELLRRLPLARRGGRQAGEHALGVGIGAAGQQAEAIELRREVVEQQPRARAVGLRRRPPPSSSARRGDMCAALGRAFLTHDQPGTMGVGGSQSGYAVGHRDTSRCRHGRVARAHPLGRARVGRAAAARGARALARHEHLAGARGGAQARVARARRARRPPRLARQGARRRRPARHLRGAPGARAGRRRARVAAHHAGRRRARAGGARELHAVPRARRSPRRARCARRVPLHALQRVRLGLARAPDPPDVGQQRALPRALRPEPRASSASASASTSASSPRAPRATERSPPRSCAATSR